MTGDFTPQLIDRDQAGPYTVTKCYGTLALNDMEASMRIVETILRHRWLIFELTKREVKLRYRGTWLGFLWTMLNPLLMTTVYTLVFSFFLRFNIPKYPVFLFCGLLPWLWFSEATVTGINSVVDSSGYLRDAIFPSEVLPVTSIASSMMNYVFSLPILLAVLLVFRVTLSWTLVALPIIMAVQFLFILGIVLFLGTYNVFFRDLRYIVQYVLLAAFFLTPVIYDYSVAPEGFQWIFKLNPMAHVINDYRSIFLYGAWPDWRDLGIVLGVGIALVILGSWVFESRKESFAEYL
jgi:lipopolysaccharide transport system permease protein